MFPRAIGLVIFSAILSYFCCSGKRYKPTWESLDTRKLPQWYDDAKFGIFLHWGLYSVPSYGNEWFWKNWHEGIPRIVNFIRKNYPPGFQYADFAPQFRAELYEPDRWADLFSKSGARYVILTSKHHEGFTLWRSNVSWNWNAVDTGPHRDLIDGLATSIRNRTKLKFGLYHSLQEWYNPLFEEDRSKNWTTDKYVKEIFLPQIYDMVNTFKPEIVWADGAAGAPDTYWKSRDFISWLYNDSPVKDTVVTNDRWGRGVLCHHGDIHTCRDRYNPGVLKKHKWENCMPVDRWSWGYRRDATLYQILGMDEILENLVKTVSCGGNLLLNVGPTSDGRITPIFEERLLQMGEWLKVNGEGIYGTKAWRVQNETITPKVWYTSKHKAVYAIFLDWPEDDKLTLNEPMLTKHTRIKLLGLKDKLQWKRLHKHKKRGVIIDLSSITMSKIPCRWAWTIKLKHVH